MNYSSQHVEEPDSDQEVQQENPNISENSLLRQKLSSVIDAGRTLSQHTFALQEQCIDLENQNALLKVTTFCLLPFHLKLIVGAGAISVKYLSTNDDTFMYLNEWQLVENEEGWIEIFPC